MLPRAPPPTARPTSSSDETGGGGGSSLPWVDWDTLLGPPEATQSVKLQSPYWLSIAICITLLLTPVAMLPCMRATMEVKAEIVASAADFASDIFCLTTNDFYDYRLLLAQLCVSVGAAMSSVLFNFALDIAKRGHALYQAYAWLPWNRLSRFGPNQFFETVDASFEKYIANLFGMLFVALGALLFPFVWLLCCIFIVVILVAVGTVLQALRLLLVQSVMKPYQRLINPDQYATRTLLADDIYPECFADDIDPDLFSDENRPRIFVHKRSQPTGHRQRDVPPLGDH